MHPKHIQILVYFWLRILFFIQYSSASYICVWINERDIIMKYHLKNVSKPLLKEHFYSNSNIQKNNVELTITGENSSKECSIAPCASPMSLTPVNRLK